MGPNQLGGLTDEREEVEANKKRKKMGSTYRRILELERWRILGSGRTSLTNSQDW